MNGFAEPKDVAISGSASTLETPGCPPTISYRVLNFRSRLLSLAEVRGLPFSIVLVFHLNNRVYYVEVSNRGGVEDRPSI